MKIAIIVSTFPPYFGGIGNVAFENARELARRGHDVTVFTPRYGREGESAFVEGVRVKRLRPFFRYGNAAFLPQLFFKLKEFDVVHLHYPFFGGAEPVALAKRTRRNFPKLMLTYHMDVVGKGFLKHFFAWHAKRIMPGILSAADRIAVSSADYAEHSLVKICFQKNTEKFRVIPNGVDTNRFFPREKDAAFLARYGIAPADRALLFVGGLDAAHYFKGLSLLLRVLGGVDANVKLLVIGEGNLRKEYEAEAEEFGVSDRVKFLGRSSAEDLPAFFAAADVTVLPSVDASEAFGVVLVESLASGTPVIASDLPGVRTVVENGKNGLLVPPGDAGKLAAAIEDILRDPERLKAFGIYGRNAATSRYDWKIIGNALEAMYGRE